MKRSIRTTLAVAVLLSSLPAGAAVTIDFEDLNVPVGTQYDPPDNTVTTSGGYDFTHGPVSSFPDLHFPHATANSVGTTTELLAHEDVVMTKSGGGKFQLYQFDWGSSFQELPSFQVVGEYVGGGTVTQEFFPDLDETTLQTFVLGPEFSGLVSVTWNHINGVSGLQNIDNVLVPEPGTAAITGLGLAMLGWRRRSH